MKKQTQSAHGLGTLGFIALGALAFVSLVNAVNAATLSSTTRAAVSEATEESRPAKISITILADASCTECRDIAAIVNAIKEMNVNVTNEKTVDLKDDGMESLLKKHNISALPALIVTGELTKDSDTAAAFETLGTIQNDTLVTDPIPPFIDTATQTVRGRVILTKLTDESCTECYDVNIHSAVLNRYGVAVAEERTLDVSSSDGKKLIETYGIERIPTIILSSETQWYKDLESIWASVGKVTFDGMYVFLSTESIGIYRDLTTDEIINPEENGEGDE